MGMIGMSNVERQILLNQAAIMGFLFAALQGNVKGMLEANLDIKNSFDAGGK